MIPAPFRVVLDACVLYPFTLRDVLLQAAMQDFYQVYWSEMILDEVLRNLIADLQTTEEQAAKLAATMRRMFPEAQVTDFEGLIPSMKNDEKDRHVVAAAVKIGAQVIVTANKRDFVEVPADIEVQSPDEFLSNLFDLHPTRMLQVLTKLQQRYGNPPMTVADILDSLGLVEFNILVQARLPQGSLRT